MAQANIDLGLLQETNITGRVYARESAGFHVAASDATFCHFGGGEIILQRVAALRGGGPPTAWTKRHKIPAGDGRTKLAHVGLLSFSA